MTEGDADLRKLYDLVLVFRHRDKRPKSGVPSEYMKSFVNATKSVYSLAKELAECDNSDPWEWVSIITCDANLWGSPHPLSHYHAYMSEVNAWLVEYRLSIGELAYNLSRSKFFQLMHKRRINRLKEIAKEANKKLGTIREAYSLSFKPKKEDL